MGKQFKIFAINSGPSGWQDIRKHLENKGYIFEGNTGPGQCLEQLAEIAPDLVLLDEDIAGTDHVEYIRQLKSRYTVPVIVIGPANDQTDKVLALESGADDFIEKPVDMNELTARVKANLRLVAQIQDKMVEDLAPVSSEGTLEVGDWTVDLDRYDVFDQQGDSIGLSHGEIELLIALARSPGRALSREQLFAHTRGQDYDSFDRAVDVQISRLRQKLVRGDGNPSIIKTVRGIGYMLDAKVTSV